MNGIVCDRRGTELDRAWLTFEPGELKATKRPFHAELLPGFVVRLQRYISQYRPLLVAEETIAGVCGSRGLASLCAVNRYRQW